MVFFYSDQVDEQAILLTGEEYTHCVKSLRHREGDHIHVLDGKGTHYTARIENIGKKVVHCSPLNKEYRSANSPKICIAISPTKSNDRIEWFIEKATELGIDDIRFVNYKNTERGKINLERWNRISLSAVKQSQSYYAPRLHPLKKYNSEFLKELQLHYPQVLLAHFKPSNENLQDLLILKQDTCIMIGPEGDLTDHEVELAENQKITTINLGSQRLRTETAGLNALMTFKLFNRF